ncbi:MAG: glycosyltransferase family 2 protein [Aquabacterium sp.]|uniref:glycosyltransferase family 2 protein n=1 Tax=Aquabacterium sp. TaxID=1872578 RepID=UPI002717C36F|nr:glycosyltransferase family 2 protein [Aquabacterium sp.]MDO9006522.1 glycosyltransferase family 2 protein [Aquabacterium sp.]
MSSVSTPFVAPLPAVPDHHLSIVVPMYNEVDNVVPFVTAVHEALANYAWPWELIIVNDGSRDGTQQALDAQAKLRGPHVRPVHLWRNFRQTAAMQAGIDAARGDVIVTLDGDLQNDPKDIPAIVAKLVNEDLDLVAGWRQNRQDGLFLRKVPSRIANRLIRKITGLEFQDLGCSLKAYRASVLKRVRLYGEMHRFIPAWMATVTSPARMSELAVSHHPRTQGESKYGISRTLRVVLDLMAVNFFLRFAGRPGHFFGGVGLGVGLIGSLILGYLGVLKMLGNNIGGRPLLWLGFFCVLGGLQFLTTGVLAELLIRIYYDRGEVAPYHTTEAPAQAPDQGWHRQAQGLSKSNLPHQP